MRASSGWLAAVGSDCNLGFAVTYDAGSVVITAQRGAVNLFCSNFESADTDGWSSVQP